jgi:hypothetical protein
MRALAVVFLASPATALATAPMMRLAIKPRLTQPQMLLEETSLLLAKSSGDELLDDVFAAVPLVVSGLALGAFAREYAMKVKPMVFKYDDLPEEFVLAPPDLPVLRNGPALTLQRPSLPGYGDSIPNLSPPDLGKYGELISYAFIPLVAAVFVAAGEAGVLNTAGGLSMKLLFDVWNTFAAVFLPGALLKY